MADGHMVETSSEQSHDDVPGLGIYDVLMDQSTPSS
jgi:hypothetical protein